MAISAASRSGTRYSFADHASTGGNDSNFGRLYSRGGALDIRNLSWGIRGQDDGVTVVRILPSIQEDTNDWTPYRMSDRRMDYGDWIRKYRCAKRVGAADSSVTYIVNHPDDSEAMKQESPYDVLIRAVSSMKRLKTGRADWIGMLEGDVGKGAVMSRVQDLYFCHAVIMRRGGKDLTPPLGITGKPVVLELTQSAATAMLNQIEQLKQGESVANDWASMYELGDPIGFDHGQYFVFYKSGDGDPRTRGQNSLAAGQQAHPANVFAAQNNSRFERNNSSMEGLSYACFALPTYAGAPANAVRQCEPALRQMIKPWNEVLEIMSYDEQAEVLSSRFPADLLGWAWTNHPQYITENLRARLANRSTFSPMPSAGWQASPEVQPQMMGMTGSPSLPGALIGPSGSVPGQFGQAPQQAWQLQQPQQSLQQLSLPTQFVPPQQFAQPHQFTQPQQFAQPQPYAQSTQLPAFGQMSPAGVQVLPVASATPVAIATLMASEAGPQSAPANAYAQPNRSEATPFGGVTNPAPQQTVYPSNVFNQPQQIAPPSTGPVSSMLPTDTPSQGMGQVSGAFAPPVAVTSIQSQPAAGFMPQQTQFQQPQPQAQQPQVASRGAAALAAAMAAGQQG